MDVGELTVNPVAGDVPKLTAVAPVKFVPVIVTGVPPVVAPEVGLTAVTVEARSAPGAVRLTGRPLPSAITAGLHDSPPSPAG